MTAIDGEVTINEDGEVSVQTPVTPNVPSGHYRAVLVLETQEDIKGKTISSVTALENAPRPPLQVNIVSWNNWPADSTFSREDIYEDEEKGLER